MARLRCASIVAGYAVDCHGPRTLLLQYMNLCDEIDNKHCCLLIDHKCRYIQTIISGLVCAMTGSGTEMQPKEASLQQTTHSMSW